MKGLFAFSAKIFAAFAWNQLQVTGYRFQVGLREVAVNDIVSVVTMVTVVPVIGRVLSVRC